MGMIMFLIASVIFSFKTTDYQKVSASNDLEYIGKLYKVTHVDNLKKVYIPYSTINFINNAGRQVYSEGSNYYYYADANNPILRSSKDLYNDYESLVYVIEYLEDEFYYYNPNCNVKNAVLSYIRGIDKRYFSSDTYFSNTFVDIYYLICGNANVDNIIGINYQHQPSYQYEFFDSYNHSGIKVTDYFASFIEIESKYNSEVYGSLTGDYLNKHLRLVNPRNNASDIDLLHMFASLDGVFMGTGQSTGQFPFNIVSSNVYRYMISWMGDLQTSLLTIAKPGIIINSFNDVLYGGYGCDYFDFNADMDAINMAFGVDLGISNKSISEIISEYYSLFNDASFSREKMFCHKIAYAAHNDPVFKFDDFKYVAYLMMDLNYVTGDEIDTYPYSTETHIICKFLFVNNSYMVTPANRRMMLTCLCNYLINYCD